MNHRIVAPLVMLATLTTLTACTQTPPAPPAPPAPIQNPVNPSHTGTETPPAPVGEQATPMPDMPVMDTPPAVIPVDTVSGSVDTVTPVQSTEVSAVTHTKTVSYKSPAGMDDIEFTVVVENGIITAVSSKTLATNDGSKYNQDKFATEVSGKVVGKSVKDFDIDTIGGASLTTEAFEKFVQSL